MDFHFYYTKKYYLEGARYFGMGDERKAIELWEKAVAVDSEFAYVYQRMSSAHWNLGMVSEGKKYAQKAFELRNRVSDRERYKIEADFYAYSEKTYDKAIEALHKLLELYPEDSSAISIMPWPILT